MRAGLVLAAVAALVAAQVEQDVPANALPRRSPQPTPLQRGNGAQARRGLLGSRHDFAPADAPLVEHCVACHGRVHVDRRAGASSQAASAPSASLELDNKSVVTSSAASSRPARGLGRRSMARSTAVCLGCHDGTVATFVTCEEAEPMQMPPRARVYVQHDHPVGVDYPRVDRGYRAAGLVTAAGIPLPNGRVECISCHDPHDTFGQRGMLVASNRRSALCLTCHIK